MLILIYLQFQKLCKLHIFKLLSINKNHKIMFSSGLQSLTGDGKHFCLILIERKFIGCRPLVDLEGSRLLWSVNFVSYQHLHNEQQKSMSCRRHRDQFQQSSHVVEGR